MGDNDEWKNMFQELTGYEKEKYKSQDQWNTSQPHADCTGTYDV